MKRMIPILFVVSIFFLCGAPHPMEEWSINSGGCDSSTGAMPLLITHFEEGPGAKDWSTYGHTWTNTIGITYHDSGNPAVGMYYNFAASSATRIDWGDPGTLDPANITMIAHYHTHPTVGIGASGEFIVAKRMEGVDDQYNLNLTGPGDGTSKAALRANVYISNGSTTAFGATEFITNAWHHLCATHDGALITPYLDGKPDGAAKAASGSIDNTTVPLRYGWGYADGYHAWGYLSRAALYNRHFSPAKVKEDAQWDSTP